MASDDSDAMDYTNGKRTQPTTPIDIPGGAKKELPEEPQPPAQSSKSDMGCGPGKSSAASVDENDDTNESTKAKENNRPNKNSDNTQENANKQKKPKTNNDPEQKPKSPSSAEPMSDDDDYNHRPSSRSSGVRRKLSTVFNDSDDDEDDKYSSFMSWSKRDIAEYRSGYPDSRQNRHSNDNYKFYTNQISSHPEGDFIDNIHKKWYGDYRKLEVHHGYIQWLFPLQEQGLNWSAEKLQKHEIELIKKDEQALKRLLKSYKLMLDFYGFQLVNEETGEIRRSKSDHYKERFHNLNFSSHNYLRITRILKCLGEFDYEYLKFPFLERILYESIIENTLPNCLRSCKDYWIETLRNKDERRAIRVYARELVEYRNKGIQVPKTVKAQRPTLPPKKQDKPPSAKAKVRSAENLSG